MHVSILPNRPSGPRRVAAIAVVLALLGGACAPRSATPTSTSTDRPSSAPTETVAPRPAPTPSSPAVTPAPTSGATPTPTPTPTPARPDLPGLAIALEPVADGLRRPVLITNAGDGSGRLFVVERDGTIRIVRDGRLAAELFLDVTGRVLAGGERGLLGLAFPPGYGAGRPAFYVHYTDRAGDGVIAAFRTRDGRPDAADPDSERVVLRVKQPYPNHNGGWVGFDPDGMLLVALGDGGSGGDPQGRGQRLDTVLGKMLRLDVLGSGPGERYRIPADNPFTDRAGARPEILHYGLRNPWRASIDRATGDLWIGDVGQNRWEELDVARRGESGLNFGWNRMEGRHCFPPGSDCDRTGLTMPIAEYGHDDGCAIIGGPVYRGPTIAALRGAVLFSDACSGTIWAIDAGLDAEQAPIPLLATSHQVAGFGEDESGEAYLVDFQAGLLLRVVGAR